MTRTYCKDCKVPSYSNKYFQYISQNIEKRNTFLRELLRKHFRTKKIVGHCLTDKKALEQNITISNQPQVLIVHLMRFQDGRKISSHIPFPEFLNTSEFFEEGTEIKPT